MRSLIVLEVKHEDTTDMLDIILDHVVERYGEEVITNYTVKVDIPECFVLENK